MPIYFLETMGDRRLFKFDFLHHISFSIEFDRCEYYLPEAPIVVEKEELYDEETLQFWRTEDEKMLINMRMFYFFRDDTDSVEKFEITYNCGANYLEYGVDKECKFQILIEPEKMRGLLEEFDAVFENYNFLEKRIENIFCVGIGSVLKCKTGCLYALVM